MTADSQSWFRSKINQRDVSAYFSENFCNFLKMEGPMKLTELIKNKGKFTYSFEVTPEISEEVIDNLKVDPVFFSVTWHAKIHKCANLSIDPIRTASLLSSKRKQVLLHLSCDMMKATYLKKLLALLQENNICNLFLALGGKLIS